MPTTGDITLALRTASSGLAVNQEALNAVANNVANVNTAGYSKKTVNFESRSVEGVGVGVKLGELTRNIDEGLLKSLRLERGKLSSLNVQEDIFARMQDLFGAPADNTSIAHIISQFAASVESLALAPEKTLEQSEMVRQAEDVAIKLRDMSTTIQELRLQADRGIGDNITEINKLAASIGNLNDTLVRNNTGNRDLSGLQDQRDREIDRLAELIDIRFFKRDDGDIVVFTASGRTLVDNVPATITHSSASSVNATTTAAEGDIGGIFVGAKIAGNDITNDISAGELKGLIEMRDNILPNLQAELDELAVELRDAINLVHNRGTAFPGLRSSTGSTNFIDSSKQSIIFNGNDDTTLTLFDNSGNQAATTTMRTLLGGAGPATIDTVASSMQTWLQANGAATATASVVNGNFNIELNSTTLSLSFRDEAATTLGSAAKDASIGFDSGGSTFKMTVSGTGSTADTYRTTINGTNVDFTPANGDTATVIRDGIIAAIQANATTNALVTATASGADAIILTPKTSTVVTTTLTLTDPGADNTYALSGFVDETVNGFSNFLGLNDFFVDNLPDSILETNVLASNFQSSAASLTFSDATGTLPGSPLTIPVNSSLKEVVALINNGITGVQAGLVPDGAGVRLRITHDQGKSLVITQNTAAGDTFLTDMGLHLADVRVSGVLAVRADISATPAKISRGAMQFDANRGTGGEYFISTGDDTAIQAMATLMTGTNAFDQSGGIGNLTISFADYGSALLARNATLADANDSNLDFQRSLTDNLQLKSDSVRGVNLDEEMAQLILFEQAFNAAARLIAVIQDMIDALDRAVQ